MDKKKFLVVSIILILICVLIVVYIKIEKVNSVNDSEKGLITISNLNGKVGYQMYLFEGNQTIDINVEKGNLKINIRGSEGTIICDEEIKESKTINIDVHDSNVMYFINLDGKNFTGKIKYTPNNTEMEDTNIVINKDILDDITKNIDEEKNNDY